MKTFVLLASASLLVSGFVLDSGQRDSSNCKCYANGKSYDPGDMACLGGFWAACNSRDDDGNNCGWDYLLNSEGDKTRCDE